MLVRSTLFTCRKAFGTEWTPNPKKEPAVGKKSGSKVKWIVVGTVLGFLLVLGPALGALVYLRRRDREARLR